MRYTFSPDPPLRPDSIVDITQDRFNSIKDARIDLHTALSIEEKAAIVLANYQDFEREILEQTLSFMLFPGLRDWSNSVETIHCVNRRIVNFTSTCRVYIDHVLHDVGVLFGKTSSQYTDLKHAMSHEYDSNLAYRVMEAIRNYTQHRSLPITGLNSSASAVQPWTEQKIKYTISPNIYVQALREGGTFKKEVLKELEQSGHPLDIKSLVRGYMDSFSAIHRKIRETLADRVARAEATLDKEGKSFKGDFPQSPPPWRAVAYGDDGKVVEKVSVWGELSKRRNWLQQKNGFNNQFLKSFVTADIDGRSPNI